MNEVYENELSQIELAKRLKVMKGITTNDSDFQELKGKFIKKSEVDRIDNIIHGLSQEDEFAILCKMMDRCSSLTALDQTPVIESNTHTADFLATFHPSASILNVPPCKEAKYNCMIEVKSTKKDKLKVTRKDLDRRTEFSRNFNLPLVYAVRFSAFEDNALWVLVDSEEVKKKYRVEVNHYVKGLGPILFDNYSVIINTNYAVIQCYIKDEVKGSIVKNEHGNLAKVVIADETGVKYIAEGADSFLFYLLLGIYRAEDSYIESDGQLTQIFSKFDIGKPVFLSDMLYSTLTMAINESGEKAYDPIRYISHIDSEKNRTVLPNRELFEDLFYRVNKKCENFFLYGQLDSTEETQEKLMQILNIERT